VTKLTKLTHKIGIQLQLVAESCTICSSCSRQPVQKLLDTHLYAAKLTDRARSYKYFHMWQVWQYVIWAENWKYFICL